MICALCGRAELVRETRDSPATYKGHTTILKNIKGEWCPSCGMGYFGPGEGDGFGNAYREFMNEVNLKVEEGETEREKFEKWYKTRSQFPGTQEEIAGEAWQAGVTSKAEWSKTGRPLNLRAMALDLVKAESHLPWHSLSEEIDDLRGFLGEEKRWD